MAHRHSLRRFRYWYAKLLRLYPKPYRDRFGEGMEQTFNDCLREREEETRGIFGYGLWMFVETIGGIMRENTAFTIAHNKRILVMGLVIALLLMIPLLAMQFTDEVSWDLADFVIMGGLLFGVGLAYELVARRSEKTTYRVAFGLALVTAFLLFWVNGAVGIIGNEGQPANLLYGAVFAVGIIGSLVARLRPRGMALTLFAAAVTQLLIPVIVLFIWPHVSWGAAGMVRTFFFNGFFVMLFAISGLLFRQASAAIPERNRPLE
jgi:hypothetical protein